MNKLCIVICCEGIFINVYMVQFDIMIGVLLIVLIFFGICEMKFELFYQFGVLVFEVGKVLIESIGMKVEFIDFDGQLVFEYERVGYV